MIVVVGKVATFMPSRVVSWYGIGHQTSRLSHQRVNCATCPGAGSTIMMHFYVLFAVETRLLKKAGQKPLG